PPSEFVPHGLSQNATFTPASMPRPAGDTVKAGDPIATVGTSGGQSSPAVYFAIRHQGRPADPTTWCRAQG
ncbi:peptidoglycan DD-metalloendopeptidase family protein, partial [Pseudomonas aeruginosa]|uniref:peptidoglycan DD-metalloendopeptidase family protein n=1 Tax=Pseudomonas aeruginosa TaxID=287 RepID=UPI001889C706